MDQLNRNVVFRQTITGVKIDEFEFWHLKHWFKYADRIFFYNESAVKPDD